MTSEEFRTNPLLLRNQFERSGTFEIPIIQKEKIRFENLELIGYDKLSSGNSNQIVHATTKRITLVLTDMESVGMPRCSQMVDRFGSAPEMESFRIVELMKQSGLGTMKPD